MQLVTPSIILTALLLISPSLQMSSTSLNVPIVPVLHGLEDKALALVPNQRLKYPLIGVAAPVRAAIPQLHILKI